MDRRAGWMGLLAAVLGCAGCTTSGTPHDNGSMLARIGQHIGSPAWTFPPPQSAPSAATVALTTEVFRKSDRQGLEGYRVRYRVLDGPPGVFEPGQAMEATLPTDQAGRATVSLTQTLTVQGRTRISVEILRASDNDPSRAVLAANETVIDWQLGTLTLQESCPPTVLVGQEVPCKLTIDNATRAPARFLTVRASLMEGMTLLRSNPPAFQDGAQLVWTLDQVPPQGKRTLEVIYQAARTGQQTGRASLVTSEGRTEERIFSVKVAPRPQPHLRIESTGTSAALLARNSASLQGLPLTYQLLVGNDGTDTAANVRLLAEIDPSLENEAGANPVEWSLGTMTPGARRTATLTLKPRRGGQAAVRLTAVSEGRTVGQAQQLVDVREAGVSLRVLGPEVRYVGRPVVWNLEVKNTGAQDLTQLTVNDTLPPELEFVVATDGGQLRGREVVWTIDRLRPGVVRRLTLTTNATRLASGAINRARVLAVTTLELSGPRVGQLTSAGAAAPAYTLCDQAEARIALHGLPAFKLRLEGKGPLEVGEQATYTLEVTNSGSLPGSDVKLVGILPPQMRPLSAGPTPYRLEGRQVTFQPIPTLAPGQVIRYVIQVQAVQAGDARFRAELTSATLHDAVVKENSILVHAVGQ
jgi:uncharacterized repeat protein (TIGR01451 family)